MNISLHPTRSRRLRLITAIAIAVGVLGALGGLASASRHTPATIVSAQSASPASTSGLIVSTFVSPTYGAILVSSRTLYTFTPGKVACTAACLKVWPQLLLPSGVTKATAGKGVKASKLGSAKLASGRLQVTYAKKKLYRFTGDKAAGQVNGNVTDKWGKWSVYVTVPPPPPPSTTTTTSGGGGIGF